jgi:hypothetical protein
LPLRGEHAETSHRRPTDGPSRTPGATPGPAPPGEPHRVWLDNLPASLEGSRLAEKLHAIAELDLEELQAIDPPRGHGRD